MKELKKKDVDFLNTVENEGLYKRRFDELENADTWETKQYDDTSSVFIYEYENTQVVIIKERGQYINYFILESEE